MKDTKDHQTKGETMKTYPHENEAELRAAGIDRIPRPRQTAEEAYTLAHLNAAGVLEDIRDELGDLPAPSDTTNWAHVGSMNEVVRQLTELRAFLRNQDR